MAYVWLTDYLANSAGLAFLSAGVLKYNITRDLVRCSTVIRTWTLIPSCTWTLMSSCTVTAEVFHSMWPEMQSYLNMTCDN